MNKRILPKRLVHLILACACLCIAQIAHAQEIPSESSFAIAPAGPFNIDALPDELKPWIPWVLDDIPHYGCSDVNGAFICAWPSTLSLTLSDTGGTFAQSVSTDRSVMFQLPGSLAQWPMHVQVNGRPVPVINENDTPMILLNTGDFVITGEFQWPKIPEGLNVPSDYALVALRINAEDIPAVQRDPDGRLWLKKTTPQTEHEDTFTLEVVRKISDGVPLMITTNIIVRSSGKPNEVTLPNVQLEGTLPIRVDSELPVRLDKDGALKLQTRGGTHQVEIVSIATKRTDSFSQIKRALPWPTEEIWVFEPSDDIRQTEVSGVAGIDPKRTNVKSEWQHLAAYSVSPEDTFTIRTTRRGESNPPPDQITLHRSMWLDMDGAGFTVADTMNGSLHRSSRLDMIDGALGHVRVGSQDQVITTNPKTRNAGVELRESQFEMHAESKIDRSSSNLRAVGWSTDVQELETILYLPPGWDLITASGVDNIPGTWWDSWSLFGFFFVLLASIAVGKLTKWYFGILTLCTLVLLHNETEVEVLVAIALPLLITLGLLKVLPKGKFRTGIIVAWAVFALVMAATAIPFSVNQIRQGLYPQLESEYYRPPLESDDFTAQSTAAYEYGGANEAPPMPAPEMLEKGDMQEEAIPQQQEVQVKSRVRQKVSSMEEGILPDLPSGINSNMRYSGNKQQAALQQDPQAVVQTGPGIPTWRWNQFSLYWQGPVSKSQQIHLYLTGPATRLTLSIARILLLALLAMVLILETFKTIKNPPTHPPTAKRASAKAAAAATALLLLHTSAAQAELPSAQRLDELRQKITRSAGCSPHCVDTSSLHLTVERGEVIVTATVHAAAQGTWPLPGPAANWVPGEVIVDGKRDTALSLRPNGFIYMKLDSGIHEVTLRGVLKSESAFTLEFVNIPHQGSVSAADYTVVGLREDGRFETSVAFTKRISDDSLMDTGNDVSYTPWLQVERTLDLGIPWLVHTTVSRVSPTGAPLMLRIPLLPGESVTESNLEVKENAVMVALGRDETSAGWSSVLKEQPKLTLKAAKGEHWTESWSVKCSPIWQCTQSGIPPVQNGVDTRVYRPWPGETLTIQTRRPKAMDGQTVTIDNAQLRVSPGVRLTETHTTINVRASQGGIQKITLPANISIQQFTVNGKKQPFKQKKNVLEVALHPGKQKLELTWQQQGGITNAFRAPTVNFGFNAANYTLNVEMPQDRWLLGVSGPSWGPAVLFWGYLLTILIVSFLILGRAAFSPLKGWHWALLTFGLTQVPIAISIIIVGWFFLVSWRKTDPLKNRQWMWKNLLQVGIGIWTLVALFCLLGAVYNGLAVQPDMQVAGLDSDNTTLNWYLDRVSGETPSATVWSVPILIWKGIMLAWSLWLAYSLIRWSKWGFKSYTEGGLWHAPPPRNVTPAVKPSAPATDAASSDVKSSNDK
ncbi:MAG: hypothetical protein JXX29_12440 [Deltaproteobacteria bacterium]|nr:hypothetical protein [Deltaproteobacteria bacterium]MBN2672483.1 hypothetical protein [Deltaproteobacteria bacterium]